MGKNRPKKALKKVKNRLKKAKKAKKGIYKWIILHKNIHWHDREGQIKGPKGLVYVIFSKK